MSSNALPGKQVWGHMVPHGLPDWIEANAPVYGSTYPLDLINGDWRATPRPTAGVARAQAAGLTGMQIMQYDWVNKGSDFMGEWMGAADATFADSDESNNFSIAPCLQVSSAEGAVRLIREYMEFAKGHPSAAKVDGRLVVYVYAPREISASMWGTVRQQLALAGLFPYLIGDLQTNSCLYGWSVSAPTIDPYLSYFDATWLFEDSTSRIWPQVVDYLSSRRKPFAGGVMPGYNRETSALGGDVPPRGTKQYREQWEASLASGQPWVNVVTWNDLVERTDIKPNSDFNHTRSDLTAFYAAKFRGRPAPIPTAELYVTSPDMVRVGEVVPVEGMVINGSQQPVTVYTRLIDSTGRAVGATSSLKVWPGTTGDATTNHVLTAMPAGRYLRAETWTVNSAGTTLQRVVGAPVLVYTADEQATTMMRQHWYSIPARKAMPGAVALKLSGSPVTSPATATATVIAPSGIDPRFAEVLANTRQVDMGYDVSSLTVRVPMAKRTIKGGQVTDSQPWGYYVGRIVDEQERVGYSAPVFVSKSGTVTNLASTTKLRRGITTSSTRYAVKKPR